MNELFDYLGHSLEGHIADVEVRECPTDDPIIAGSGQSPFNNHLYCAFLIPDDVSDESVEKIKTYRFEPAAQALANILKRFQIVEAQPLPIPEHRNPVTGQVIGDGTIKKIVMAGDLPVRFTATYDIRHTGTLVTVDMLVRHVGNFYKTIINGPMHRYQMPFKEDPIATRMENINYHYMPLSLPDYYVEGHDAYSDDPQPLPGLDKDELHRDSLHLYRVKGDYCYYRGESYL